MEIKTCEEYVLTRLGDVTARAERQAEQILKLRENVARLEDRLTAPKSEIAAAIEDAGRRALFAQWFAPATAVDGKTFDDWARAAIWDYSLPRHLRADAVREFDEELREAYEKKLLEEMEPNGE